MEKLLRVQFNTAEVRLASILSEWPFSEEHFIENNAKRPDINLVGNDWIILNECLRRKIVKSANPLRGQSHL